MTFLLPILIFLPAAAAVLLMLLRSPDGSVARWGALLGSLATLGVSLIIASQFAELPKPESTSDTVVQPKFEVRHDWLTFKRTLPNGTLASDVKLEFYFGMDGTSLLMAILTALLTVSAVLISWQTIKDRATEYYACLLILETGLLGAFTSFDLLLFYVFFEFTLIPLFLLVGIWGGPDRRYAAGKFFLYTLCGSLVTLIGLVSLGTWVINNLPGLETPFSIPDLSAALVQKPIPTNIQVMLFLLLSAGFVIKVPLFPFHSWLPLAHTEAPTAGSVLLAGVLLKLGTYGFLRICLPLLPSACISPGVPIIATLSVVGIIFGALAALVQNDIKKLVAYSSVSHLGFCMLGLFALNQEGISGSILQMINHGLSTGALFLVIGMVYDRYHTRKMDEIGGLASHLKLISICMVFTCFSSMGLPGLNGFVGEVLCLIGMFKAQTSQHVFPWYAVLGATGVILGAWYLMTMMQKAFFGPLRLPDTHGEEIHDLQPREALLLIPILALCLWIGVAPQTLLDTIDPDVKKIVRLYDRVRGENQPAVTSVDVE
ncbi:MAG: NADH-quinone oxidoreductase subunit M [Planctomycetaceae bacterium]|nr:NADH-quinone oxidoreductase subunit M [Planctomycetaceae bacterium]